MISIAKTDENFRLLYDVRGRFAIHRISAEEAKYKLGRVKKVMMGPKGTPYIVTHDGRTIRYPDPAVKANDTVKIELETGKMSDHIKFETGNLAMISGGKNTGRVGVIVSRERHQGSFDIVHMKDAAGARARPATPPLHRHGLRSPTRADAAPPHSRRPHLRHPPRQRLRHWQGHEAARVAAQA